MEAEVVHEEVIAAQIHGVRGQKVMLAQCMAAMYAVPTRRLNEHVERNAERFPEDFMFLLSETEWDLLEAVEQLLDRPAGERLRIGYRGGDPL